jgi:hypothetical protein
MDLKVSALERAFQLAGSGQAASIDDIKKRLKREGYTEKAVDGGPSLAGQLRKLISEASERKGGPIAAPLALLDDRLSPLAAASAVAAAGLVVAAFADPVVEVFNVEVFKEGSHAGACRRGQARRR